MITTSNIARPLLALAAALIAAPLAAEAPVTVTGEPVFQERVSYTDLDLRRASGRQSLKARVAHAADRLCEQANGPFAVMGIGVGSTPTCADLTYRDAKPQIAAAIERARLGQQFAAATVVISAPRAGR